MDTIKKKAKLKIAFKGIVCYLKYRNEMRVKLNKPSLNIRCTKDFKKFLETTAVSEIIKLLLNNSKIEEIVIIFREYDICNLLIG